MNERNPTPFTDIGEDWSRPRKLRGVLDELGYDVPEKLTAKMARKVVSGLQDKGIEMGSRDKEPFGTDARGLKPDSRVRLRRRKSPPSDAVLSAIMIENFKSFARAKLPLSELTVLIGANASGKSNALEALQLLSWLARGQGLAQLRFDVKDRKLGLRGRIADLFRIGSESKTFGLGCSLAPDASGYSLFLTIKLAWDGERLRIVHEELECPEEKGSYPLYRVTEPAQMNGREMLVAYNNFAKGGKKPQITCVDEIPVFSQLVSPARFSESNKRSQKVIPRATSRVSEALSNVLFLDPDPRSMRGYANKADTTLGGDGTNLSSVLHHITETRGMKEEVLAFVQALPEQTIRAIDYIDTPRGETMVQLTESFGEEGQATDAALLSDGTLRVLAIAAALLSVSEGSMVVIEEIDNGVHPSRAADLMKRIMDTAKSRHLRVLLTTHNPALLDSVPTEALPHVVASFRDPEDGCSRLVRLQDLETYPELTARGRLGHLVTRGILERYLKDTTTDEERRARYEQWFAESFDEAEA